MNFVKCLLKKFVCIYLKCCSSVFIKIYEEPYYTFMLFYQMKKILLAFIEIKLKTFEMSINISKWDDKFSKLYFVQKMIK